MLSGTDSRGLPRAFLAIALLKPPHNINIVAAPLQCDDDDMPSAAEGLLHTVEEECEDDTCNSVDDHYNAKLCPTKAPTAAPATKCPTPTPTTAAPTVDDHHNESHFWLDVMLVLTVAALLILVIVMMTKEKGGNPLFGGGSDSDK